MNTKAIQELTNLRNDIIATPYGSLVQTYLILNGIEWTDGEFVKRFKSARFPFLGDEQFIQKTLEAVNLDYNNLIGKPVAVCENTNTIFCPYISGYGEVVLLPLFKDKRLLHSQEYAMASDSFKLIDWSEE